MAWRAPAFLGTARGWGEGAQKQELKKIGEKKKMHTIEVMTDLRDKMWANKSMDFGLVQTDAQKTASCNRNCSGIHS